MVDATSSLCGGDNAFELPQTRFIYRSLPDSDAQFRAKRKCVLTDLSFRNASANARVLRTDSLR